MQPYARRGWCVMEFNASGLVKDDEALISLKALTGEEDSLSKVISNGQAAREPPVAPTAFASTLEAGVASGVTKFTNSGDVGLVGKIYGWAFAAEMAAVVSLSYHSLGWDDAQMTTLCEALRAAHAGGGLRKLERLDLRDNKMGDGAMTALAALLEEGAMPNLFVLNLTRNQICDAGMAALGSALRGGALPSCWDIKLKGNGLECMERTSCAPVDKGLASPERKLALARRQAQRQDMATAVDLSYNRLGWDDAQMLTLCEALRAAHAGGGLRKLELLYLNYNEMGDEAMAALVALLEEGAMPNLEKLYLSNNQISDTGVAALAATIRGGAMPSCKKSIYLEGNPGSDAPVKEALASPERAAALARRQARRQDIATADELVYRGCGWDDAQVLALCEALRVAHAGGGLTKLERIYLEKNEISDGAMTALAALLQEGAMPNLRELNFSHNQISDAGVAVLASALRGGVLPSCMGIYLSDNPGSSDPVDKALRSRERAAALALRQNE
eukprot:scaffold43655_cov51-Phaeocystis_antarctica.AAC.2